jgi:hypothetical protein
LKGKNERDGDDLCEAYMEKEEEGLQTRLGEHRRDRWLKASPKWGWAFQR